MFEGMDADQAVERINSMEDVTAAQLLYSMNSRKASQIMSLLDPEKVKTMTKLMQKMGDTEKAK